MSIFSKLVLFFCVLLGTASQAQTSKSFSWDNDSNKDDVVMTWNKLTPEQEMKDDIKALAQRGITIKYKDVKRNAKNEITAISVTFEDRKGNKGSLNYDNQKPISTIKFFKQGDEIGFGEPTNSFNSTNFMNGFGGNGFNGFNGNGFNFNNDESNPNQQFEFSFPDAQSFGNGKSKMIIKQGDKKTLIIEDGKVIEGGDDYTKEELDEILKNNKVERYNGNNFSYDFFNDKNDINEQMQKMQQQIDELMQNRNPQSAPKNEELEQSKEELEKAKEELKKAKKELEETKSSLKVKKI